MHAHVPSVYRMVMWSLGTWSMQEESIWIELGKRQGNKVAEVDVDPTAA